MSKQQHADATLEGWDGPFFPESVDELRAWLDELGDYHGTKLAVMGRVIDGYNDIWRPTTSDGYGWFWGLLFSLPIGRVTVLIPWSQDWDRSDGTQQDRSIAVYTQGCGADTAGEVVTQLTTAVKGTFQREAERRLSSDA